MTLSHLRTATFALLGALALPVLAQSAQPLRAILPVGPGSGVDTITRTVAPSLTKALTASRSSIENMPGAGGITGTQAIVKAAPDGNTIGVVSNNHVINPSVYKKMPFDSINDITPIMVVGSTPMVLVVNPEQAAGEGREGTHRGAQGQARRLQLRVVGQRHDPASRRRSCSSTRRA